MKKQITAIALAMGLLLPVVSYATTPPNCKLMKRDETALACTIYYEARGATRADKLAVSFITINRSKDQDKSLVSIVKQKGQYSFMKRSNLVPLEAEAWDESKKLAIEMIKLSKDPILYEYMDFTQGALYYHDRSIKNPWNFTLTLKTPNILAYRK